MNPQYPGYPNQPAQAPYAPAQQGQPAQGAGYPAGPSASAAPPSAPGMNPRVQEALGMVDLLANEQIYYAIQADGFFVGSAPILKLIAAISAFMVTITGGYIRIFLVVTNQLTPGRKCERAAGRRHRPWHRGGAVAVAYGAPVATLQDSGPHSL